MTKKERAELLLAIEDIFDRKFDIAFNKAFDKVFGTAFDKAFGKAFEEQLAWRFAQLDERITRNTELILDLQKEQKSLINDVILHIASESDRRLNRNEAGINKIKVVCNKVGKEFVKLAK